MNKTEPYEYVIIIFSPILTFILISLCIRYTFYFCHGGPCIENDELENDAEVFELENDAESYEADRLENDVDEDRFDGFDNISM